VKPSSRSVSSLPPQNIDVRGCAVFRWRLTPSSLTDAVQCKLPPRLRTYLIRPDGSIQVRVPRAVTPGYEDAAMYRYADAFGRMHDLGTYNLRTVKRYRPGNVETDGESRIIDLRDVESNWASGALRYGFSLNTTRPFIGDVALASFFGAMLEVGYTDIVCTGFSTDEGKTAGGSSSHVNGTNGDFRYLRNDGNVGPLHLALELGAPELLDEVRQTAFNEALYRFGWKSMLSYRYELDGEVRLLARTRHYKNHHHHLHLQGYSPTVEEVHE
jgi:hypothetical protein